MKLLKPLALTLLLAALFAVYCNAGADADDFVPSHVTPEVVRERVTETPVPETVEPSVEPEPIPERTYLGTFTTYGYCKGACCCGEWSKVESPEKVPGECVAADLSVLPKGTVIYIEGLGGRVVMDTGGAIKGYVLDVMYPDHETALAHGKQELEVWRIE